MPGSMAKSIPLWIPSNPGASSIDRYRQRINRKFQLDLVNSTDLHKWTITRPHDFWLDLYEYLGFQPSLPKTLTRAYNDGEAISKIPAWFVGHEFNYAENALYANPDPDAVALIGIRECTGLMQVEDEKISWREFREKVRVAASALRQIGVGKGDRVAALVATSVWAVVLFHAAASIGAIFTSVSPDLGLEGCIARFKQVSPSVLFADGDVLWKGQVTPILNKLDRIAQRLSPKPRVYVLPIVSTQDSYPTIDDFLALADPSDELTFTRVPVGHPLIIVYSSGTTGDPKCIVHSHSILLQMKKIAVIHNGTTNKDIILQYSSTSWIVFYIMCGYTACGATTLLYSGSPTYPRPDSLLQLLERYRVTFFGTSPRYLLELEQNRINVQHAHDLASLRIVYCTGATLSADQYRWFYRTFPKSVHLCNTAGGTDTATSLVAGDPSSPVYPGEMQMFALGMDVDILHPETAQSIRRTGEPGELVIRQPFPRSAIPLKYPRIRPIVADSSFASMPCFFWKDRGNIKYQEAYFSRFTTVNVWAQADWLSQNPITGGLVMHGRSDGVLNPSGVRFGSGEIYAIVEAAPFNHMISTTLCVGRRRPHDRDEVVFLFVVMREPHALTEELVGQLRSAIREGLSARHVPKFILQVPEIPVTINGKKVETIVKQTISGRHVTPSNTVQNPESLEHFRSMYHLDGAKL